MSLWREQRRLSGGRTHKAFELVGKRVPGERRRLGSHCRLGVGLGDHGARGYGRGHRHGHRCGLRRGRRRFRCRQRSRCRLRRGLGCGRGCGHRCGLGCGGQGRGRRLGRLGHLQRHHEPGEFVESGGGSPIGVGGRTARRVAGLIESFRLDGFGRCDGRGHRFFRLDRLVHHRRCRECRTDGVILGKVLGLAPGVHQGLRGARAAHRPAVSHDRGEHVHRKQCKDQRQGPDDVEALVHASLSPCCRGSGRAGPGARPSRSPCPARPRAAAGWHPRVRSPNGPGGAS